MEGGWPERVHTLPTIRPQTNAEHKWGVAVLLLLICNPSKKLLEAALLQEREADKFYNDTLGIVYDLTPNELELLRYCDLLDFALWAKREIRMGNTLMTPAYELSCKKLRGRFKSSVIDQVLEAKQE